MTTQRPNVVFILVDQQRWDFIGYESNGVTFTPHLDALARTGTIFHSAYCTAPLCCPSRAAIASGRYGMSSGCFTNLHELPPGTPSFVSQLRRSGYRTCAIGKTHMQIHAYNADYTSEAHRRYMNSLGWDEICETSGDDMFRHGIRCSYSDFLLERGALDDAVDYYSQWHYFMSPPGQGDPAFVCHPWTLAEALHPTAFVGDRVLDWLRCYDRAQPFFLQVGISAPHSPISPLPAHFDLYRDRPETDAWGNAAPPDWLADGRRGYRAMITHIDEYVGRIRDCLAELGMLENTILVYTADHGEMAGDHQLFAKTTFFEGSARVPMLWSGPGIRPGQQSDALVEVIDVGKTICELTGVEPHALDQGRSLAPLLTGTQTTHRETIYCEMGCDRMLRDERYKLCWGEPTFDTRRLGRLHLDKPVNIPPSPPGLYDLREDPHELNNLASDPAARSLLQTMQAKLLTRINENTQTQPFKSRGEYRPLTRPA